MLLRPFIDGFVTWFTLLRQSWHSASVSVIAQVMTPALTVLLATRGLGVSAFGQVMAIIAFYGWFILVANYDTGALISRVFADPSLAPEEKSRACATAFWLRLLLSLLALGGALLLLPWALRRLNLLPLWQVALLYAPVFIIGNFKAFLDAIFQYCGQLRRWSISMLVFNTLPVILLFGYMLAWKHLTPLTYVLLLVISFLAGLLFSMYLWLTMFGGKVLLRPDLSRIGPLFAAGRGPWIATFCNVLINFGAPTLIAAYLPSRELGLYSVVISFCGLVFGVGLAVVIPAISDWSKLAAAHEYAELRKDFRRRQMSTAVVLGAGALLAIIAAEPILRLLYGPEYVAAAPLLRAYAVVWVTTGLGGWYWHYLFAIGHYHRVAYPNIAIGVPTFLLSFLFLQYTHLGALGVVIATDIGTIAWLLTYEWHFRQIQRRMAAGHPSVAAPDDPVQT